MLALPYGKENAVMRVVTEPDFFPYVIQSMTVSPEEKKPGTAHVCPAGRAQVA